MSQNPPPGPRPGPDDQRQPWMGAPGYQPHRELPPHAPMPGAPPYPPMPAHPPAPVGPQRTGTSFPRVLGAAGIVVVLHLAVILAVNGPPPSAGVLGAVMGGMIIPALLGSLIVWLSVRRRDLRYWVVVLLVLAAYLAVTVVANVGANATR